jgi:hypothetical protein
MPYLPLSTLVVPGQLDRYSISHLHYFEIVFATRALPSNFAPNSGNHEIFCYLCVRFYFDKCLFT